MRSNTDVGLPPELGALDRERAASPRDELAAVPVASPIGGGVLARYHSVALGLAASDV